MTALDNRLSCRLFGYSKAGKPTPPRGARHPSEELTRVGFFKTCENEQKTQKQEIPLLDRQCHQLKRLSKAVIANEVKQSPEISIVFDAGDRHASLAMTGFSLR